MKSAMFVHYACTSFCCVRRFTRIDAIALVTICLTALVSGFGTLQAQTLIPQNSTWKYRKGTSEASNPVGDWRKITFNDSTWSSGAMPFYYGETFSSGTTLNDMRTNYLTVFLRKTIQVQNPADYDPMTLRTLVDDGYIVWINAHEIARFNVPAGEPAYNTAATASIEQTWVTNIISGIAPYLVAGTNVVAVQLFNQALTSSDIVLNLQLDTAADKTPPTILSVSPPAGDVAAFNSITITFSEPVQGVLAQDLLINNTPTTSVSASGNAYTFRFDPPTYGIIDVSWDAGQRITDLAVPPLPFDSTAASANWRYTLKDSTAPTLTSITPPPSATVRTLSQVEVRFSESVTNVDAADLLINGTPATSVTAKPGNLYVFQFPPRSPGTVNISWAANHGITDIASPPNGFAATQWSYTVNPNYITPKVEISEFLAAEQNLAGLKDEDGSLEDWIEIHNASSSAVNLAGWSLTNDPEDPDLWIFPSVTLGADARLVVFASAKDRKPTQAGSNLHTNFKLNASGEYLALFSGDSPRVALTEFKLDFPPQRNDYSYGLDSSGAWKYFQTPTPGQPNGSSSIVGLLSKPKPNIKRGLFDAPFSLVLTNDLLGATVRYTTDGSEPTDTTGQVYSSPLTIDKTTVLRAAAFMQDHLPSESITHTYIFLDQVMVQPNNPPGFPVGATVMAGYPSDYEMDPEIVNDPAYKSQMKDALKALPIISIVIKMDDMFGTVNGIYTHPLSRGPQWEKPCSMEFMPQDGNGFQANAGIQIQGNAARDPQKQPKHPMRVVFKGAYGASTLSYRMFPDSPVQVFDTLVLRADFNFSWLHWDTTQRRRGQRTRDSWMKDSMRAMGNLASHNRYTHLYINGVYWGIYDPSERPDGSFAAAYLGGQKEDWDVVNEGAAVDGGMTAYNAMLALGNLSTTAGYNAMKVYLDMPQFIDYMLLHFYVGHEDWGRNKNWYTMRPKNGSAGFKYVPWDGENLLNDPAYNRVSNTDVPSGLHTNLLSSAQYKMDFADRVQKHFFNGGALTPAQSTNRWINRAREVELPIIAESARWGDYRRDVHQYSSAPYELYTRDDQWRSEQARLLTNYFPGRTATVLSQLRSAGLYPSVAAPSFNQFGGKISPGFQLQITAAAGTIYYSTNGVDPRVYGTGAIDPAAKTYSTALTLNGGVVVKSRAYSGGTWSALNEATFTTDSLRVPLRITEIMFNPDPPGDAYEFIELQSFSTLPLDVSGFYLTGVDYVFPPRTILAPGQIILLASGVNPTSFQQRYPGVTPFAYYGGKLLNSGERLAIIRPDGQTVTSVDYNDAAGWPAEADGHGFSLEVVEPFGNPDDPANWHASASLNGSPGKANSIPPAPKVLINEVLAHSSIDSDWVELRQTGTTAIDLSGWTLTQVGNTNRFTFPAGTAILANGYLVVRCDKQTNATGLHAPFALDADGESLVLSDSTGSRVHAISFGPQVSNLSFGNVNGAWTLCDPTAGTDNRAVVLGDPATMIINEWLASSPAGESDWIELYNPDPSKPVALQNLFIGVTNQVFEFTTPAFIAPRGYVRFFADENAGFKHIDFKLPSEGASIALYDASGKVINQVSYGAQTEGVSQGRFPDGTGNIIDFPISPTPGAANSLNFPISGTITNGEFEVLWSSVVGRNYRVELNQDLGSTIWTPLQTITATNGVSSLRDAITPVQKYYRVLALP